jgi:hypothetical protein
VSIGASSASALSPGIHEWHRSFDLRPPKSYTYPMMVERWAGVRIVALVAVLGMFSVVSCSYPANALPSPPTSVTSPSVESSPQGSSPFSLVSLAMAPGVAYAANNQGLTQNGGGNMILTKSKAGESVVFAARKLMNNLWGAPAEEELTSSIYLHDSGQYGWEWNRPKPVIKPGQTYVQPLYPSVRVGGSPWERSNARAFPAKLGSIDSLRMRAAYSFPALPTGRYDLAYDIFLVKTADPSVSPRISAEVMIWVEGTAKQPPERYKGDFPDGTDNYRLYAWVMADGRQYYAFVLDDATGTRKPRTVDAKRLMEHLNLDPDWYVHGIEFGSEIWDGAGKIQIDEFAVALNGESL